MLIFVVPSFVVSSFVESSFVESSFVESSFVQSNFNVSGFVVSSCVLSSFPLSNFVDSNLVKSSLIVVLSRFFLSKVLKCGGLLRRVLLRSVESEPERNEENCSLYPPASFSQQIQR